MENSIVKSRLCWLLSLVLSATAAAQPPAGNPLERIATGTSIQVKTEDGRTLDGMHRTLFQGTTGQRMTLCE